MLVTYYTISDPRENPAPEDLAPGDCSMFSHSNLTNMLNSSFFNSSRVRREEATMVNSLSMEEMLLEVCFPSPILPYISPI